jgi:crotonobetainyl-CoA:carnitine CoA-transferase CaiB-like acyl-CoA transferase
MTPLTGTRILTIALNVPGPLAAARLRDAGATVSKIEPPGGDPLKEFCPTWYEQLHSGVSVERLNLKSPDGAARIRNLLAECDLFVASQRPAALERLGLDADTLTGDGSTYRRLRHLNIVGELARPEIAGHDLTYLARAGLLGGELPRTLIADVIGSERAFSTALLLLHEPAGSRAVVGLFDSLAPLVAPLAHGLTAPGRLLGGALPAYGIYDTRDGRIAVAALEPHFRQRLYELLGASDHRGIAAVLRTRTAAEWEGWALSHDLPMSVVTESAPSSRPSRPS